ncbi:cation diffusion facilitator family transporter [Laceyella putida]|uniref:Cation diffusion facilitator family transporter n=1 Tax=Laceyella putida TaxID=110101 RepID=A0ABW2RMK7_9BACL
MVAAWIGLVSNIVLTIMKIGVGFAFRSPSLVADGAHNAADVIASGATLGSMRVSKQPADEDHPYGHGKAEVIASGIVAVILFIIGLYMIYHSIESLFEPAVKAHWLSFVAALFSLIWKQFLYVYTIRVGRETKSKGLIATAYDHLTDVYASLAAVIGIGAAIAGQSYHLPYTQYGDPVASIIVSLLILKISLHMGRESIDILMERNLPGEKINEYARIILSIPHVKRIDRIRAREHGHYTIVDVRVGLPGELTIQEGHDTARKIKQALMEVDGEIQEVLIHLNPWYEGKG